MWKKILPTFVILTKVTEAVSDLRNFEKMELDIPQNLFNDKRTTEFAESLYKEVLQKIQADAMKAAAGPRTRAQTERAPWRRSSACTTIR